MNYTTMHGLTNLNNMERYAYMLVQSFFFFFLMFQCEISISLPWKLLMNIININNIFPNMAQFSNICLCYRKASLQKKRNWMMMRIGEIHSISLNVALSMNMTIEQWPRICELLFKSLCTFRTLKFTKKKRNY